MEKVNLNEIDENILKKKLKAEFNEDFMEEFDELIKTGKPVSEWWDGFYEDAKARHQQIWAENQEFVWFTDKNWEIINKYRLMSEVFEDGESE